MAENYYLNHTATQIDAILTKVDGIAAGANVNVQVDWNQTTTTADDYIKNKPTIPAAQVNSDWDAVSGVAQILNKPAIPDAQIQSDWNQTNTESKDFIKNKPTIPDAQIQSDWNQTDTESKDFIKNKPTIPEAQVNSDWSAASGVAQILNKPTLGTAAASYTTTSIESGGTGLPTSGTVYTDQQRQDAEIGSLVDRGAKNLFKAEAPSATSQNGATITDNGDGTYGVTTNGNPTTAAVWVSVGTVALTEGDYIMTGGADSEKCLLAVNDDGEVKYVGPGTTIISGTGTTGKQLYIHVPSGRSIGDTLTVKPMICTQGDYAATPAFEQYAPTNRELYEMIGDINTILEEVL